MQGELCDKPGLPGIWVKHQLNVDFAVLDLAKYPRAKPTDASQDDHSVERDAHTGLTRNMLSFLPQGLDEEDDIRCCRFLLDESLLAREAQLVCGGPDPLMSGRGSSQQKAN